MLGSGTDDPTRPNLPFEFAGRALRQTAPDPAQAPYPLVIISHGYPGSRVLMTYLSENLASKGYVVTAIDHTESTHGDKADFSSTLLNRPLDILFVLGEMVQMGEPNAGSFLGGTIAGDKVGLIGYSMGGYGALNATGVGVRAEAANSPFSVPGGKLKSRQTDQSEYLATLDQRIRAVVALAPWGYPLLFDAESMKGLKIPSLFIVGSRDETSGYENV